MKKVKLTQEQAKAIEYALQGVIKYRVNPDKLLLHASMDNVIFHNVLEPLNTIDVATLAKALYIGYEVEPEFKVGDWVVWRSTEGVDVIKQIEKVEGYKIWADWLDKGNLLFASSDEIRHATPDEIAKEKRRRWWARHGREVWELKAGDLLKDRITREVVQVREVKDNRAVIGNYTIYENRDYIKNCYLVACFAESRLDQ